MTSYNFDTVINRRGTNSAKYDIFDNPDILSLWVADMDFPAPNSVMEAISKRLENPIFGYMMDLPELRDVLQERLARLYDWHVQKEDFVFLPGVVAGFNVAMRAVGQPGDNVLTHTPIYPPFLLSPPKNRMTPNPVPLTMTEKGGNLYYTVDFEAFEQAINAGTKLFILCSPHNPTGRIWTRDELQRMADICIAHNVVICSDEIHADLVFQPHTPIASLNDTIAQNTITLMAPSKTFNIPSMGFSFAVIQNPELRKKFTDDEGFVVPHVTTLGYYAAYGAYIGGDEWLSQLLPYLQENRDIVTHFIREHLPQIKTTHPEGTYLSWLDCRSLPPYDDESVAGDGSFMDWIEPFFLKQANVALNNGVLFGEEGKGFSRLNFALPRQRLIDALERMKQALGQLS